MTNTQVGFILSAYFYSDKSAEDIYKSAETFARLMNQIDNKLFKEAFGEISSEKQNKQT